MEGAQVVAQLKLEEVRAVLETLQVEDTVIQEVEELSFTPNMSFGKNDEHFITGCKTSTAFAFDCGRRLIVNLYQGRGGDRMYRVTLVLLTHPAQDKVNNLLAMRFLQACQSSAQKGTRTACTLGIAGTLALKN